MNHPIRSSPMPFQPKRMLGGGHRQTVWSAFDAASPLAYRARPLTVTLRDGDCVVLHDDQPPAWRAGDPSLLLIHGLCGCHAAGYMVRLAARFNAEGVRTFRLDMRGCGAAVGHSRALTHAGRSDDVVDALAVLAQETVAGPIWALGVSLGGNQLLRAVGRIDSGQSDVSGQGLDRLQRIAAIAPPIDLAHCSRNMQRPSLRFYNWYFIRKLLRSVPTKVRQGEAFQRLVLRPRPRTLRELDERITAPMSGFRDAEHYYADASAAPLLQHLVTPTWILASQDDPIVPADCFTNTSLSSSVRMMITQRGGHAGFIARRGEAWMDDCLVDWFQERL